MTTTSNIGPAIEWSKSRLDEMDATLSVLENQTKDLGAASSKAVAASVADMKEHREAFQTAINKAREADAKAWDAAKARLEVEWKAFEDSVDAYAQKVGHTAGAFENVFQARVAANKRHGAMPQLNSRHRHRRFKQIANTKLMPSSMMRNMFCKTPVRSSKV